MGSLGTYYFYIIWLSLRERQYAVVLQWLGCGEGRNPKASVQGQGLTSLTGNQNWSAGERDTYGDDDDVDDDDDDIITYYSSALCIFK